VSGLSRSQRAMVPGGVGSGVLVTLRGHYRFDVPAVSRAGVCGSGAMFVVDGSAGSMVVHSASGERDRTPVQSERDTDSDNAARTPDHSDSSGPRGSTPPATRAQETRRPGPTNRPVEHGLLVPVRQTLGH